MESLLVAIPTLGRPRSISAVARSARATVPHARVLFLCSPEDDETTRACLATGEEVCVVPWRPVRADWARKLNLAYERMGEEWILLGATDLRFHPGWFDAAMAATTRHPDACMVGTNDLGNQRVLAGQLSTHPLVHRDYVACCGGGVIDDPASGLLATHFGHWFVDEEATGTARARGVYVHAHDAVVEHLHPNWGKGRDDDTYRRGQASIEADRDLFKLRRPLWDRRSRPGG